MINRLARATTAFVTASLISIGCAYDASPPSEVAEQASSAVHRNYPDTPGGIFADRPSFYENYSSTGMLDTDFVSSPFVQPGDVPIAGDWDGDGIATPGVVRGTTWILLNSSSPNSTTTTFVYGDVGDIPVVGDWDGNGTDTPGVVRQAHWYLKNSLGCCNADVDFVYGDVGDTPIAGDWDGNGTSTPGVVRDAHWYLRNSNSYGVANVDFNYGTAAMHPVVGDWDGNGTDTPGGELDGHWWLRNSNSWGNADSDFDFGAAGFLPVAGRWTSAPPIVEHGGPVLLNPTVYPIFYGTWSTADRHLVMQFLRDLRTSAWYSMLNRYYHDAQGRSPAATFNVGTAFVDSRYSQGHVMNWAHVDAAIERAIAARALPSDPNGVYVVIGSADLNTDRKQSTCGIHTKSDEGRAIAYVYNPGCNQNSDCNSGASCVAGVCSDGVSSANGCLGYPNIIGSPNGNPGIDGLLGTLAHEVAEAVTDPYASAWFGVDGQHEIGDLCVVQFGPQFAAGSGVANLSLNGHNYFVQELFNPKTNFCAMHP